MEVQVSLSPFLKHFAQMFREVFPCFPLGLLVFISPELVPVIAGG